MNARIPQPDVQDSDFGAFAEALASSRPENKPRAAVHYGHQAALAGNEYVRDDFAGVDFTAVTDRIRRQCTHDSVHVNYPALARKLSAFALELSLSLNKLNGYKCSPPADGASHYWVTWGDSPIKVEAFPPDPENGSPRAFITSALINGSWIDVQSRFLDSDIRAWTADVEQQIADDTDAALITRHQFDRVPA